MTKAAKPRRQIPEQRPGVGGVGSPGPLPSLAMEQIHGVGLVVHREDAVRRHDDAGQVTVGGQGHAQVGTETSAHSAPPSSPAGHTLIYEPTGGPVQRLIPGICRQPGEVAQHVPAFQMYQGRRPVLRFDKGALATRERGAGAPKLYRAAVRRRPGALQRNGGLPMDASAMFLDCPAYMDKTGSVRCGLPAEVQDRYLMRSTDGPLESVKIRCPRGHWFNGPVESLTLEERPDLSAQREAIARIKGAGVRRPGS